VQAADQTHGWLLLRAAPGLPLDQQPDAGRWAQALRRYAELQGATARQATQLAALGLPVRDGAWLLNGLDALLADEAAFLVGQPDGLSRDELTALRARGPLLRERCVELLACGFTVALEHGDFGPWQVLADGERITFLDWSDCAIANPLWSLASLLSELPSALATPSVTARLVDAYLAPWETLVPRPMLQHAWELSARLSGLYGALVYHREILPRMELRWEMERMLPFFARQLLA
jgi:hypothetical protein